MPLLLKGSCTPDQSATRGTGTILNIEEKEVRVLCHYCKSIQKNMGIRLNFEPFGRGAGVDKQLLSRASSKVPADFRYLVKIQVTLEQVI
jgi:hypothetical protein